jgi:ATP-dependent 26S proteasome regulatory subunit
VQALFDIAREKQPSVIFFDEIDALMSARKVRAKQLCDD